MRYSLTDICTVGIFGCALVLTGVVVSRQWRSAEVRSPVTQIARRPEVELVGVTIGSPVAKVPIVVFADFQCQYCAEAHRLLKTMLSEHAGEIKVLYRHFPIARIHPLAVTAAIGAECANAQRAAPAYFDLLYSAQDSIGRIPWKEIADRAGVPSSSEFERCLAEERYLGEIERDLRLAQDLKLAGTPTLIIGDQAYAGVPPASWLRKQIATARQRER